MATAKKTAKKAVTKRPLSVKEYETITNKYYALKGYVFKLAESGKLHETPEKELRKFLRSLEKTRAAVNWPRATGYMAG